MRLSYCWLIQRIAYKIASWNLSIQLKQIAAIKILSQSIRGST